MINHIAFIMDGNRRFGKLNKLSKKETYKVGLEKCFEFIKYQVKYNIKETSFFALSVDNYLKRPKEEKITIFNLIDYFNKNKLYFNFLEKNKIRVYFKGNIKELEMDTSTNMKKIVKNFEKKNNLIKEPKFIVNIVLNYDGQKEIIHAFKEIYKKLKQNQININNLNENLIKENIYFNKSKAPEIIVRPGDAPRLSGFMLWDSKYSEIYLTKKLWPQLNENDFKSIINWYNKIKRNFGK